MSLTETYKFTCKRDRLRFEASAPVLSRNKHMILAVLTLGVWYVLFAFFLLVRLYWLSRCPECGKRSRKLLFLILSLVLFSVELIAVIHHFTVTAPMQIVADASMTDLPSDIDLTGDLDREGFIAVMTYLWITALLPTAGLYITAYAPYMILAWFSLVVLIGLWVPSRYQTRQF